MEKILITGVAGFIGSHVAQKFLHEGFRVVGVDDLSGGNIANIPADVAEKTKKSVTAAFDEDKHLLEKIQAQVSADPRGLDYLEVTLGADGAGIRVRQVLKRKLAAEGRTLN